MVWTIAIDDAITAKKHLSPNTPENMDTLIAFIFSLNQPQIKWMLQHGLQIWHKMQHSGTALWSPPAYLLFERICVLRLTVKCLVSAV